MSSACRKDGAVMFRDTQHGAVFWIEAECVTDAYSPAAGAPESEASVVRGGGADIVAVGAMWRPCSSCTWVVEDETFRA